MQLAAWPSANGDEYALAFDRGREQRVLVLPALFDEANKTRQLVTQAMRRLDGAGIDSFLPDLPGCNESLAPLDAQALASWRNAGASAAKHFGATHLLTIRASAILAPPGLPGWRYAPTGGANALRALLRARVISAREAGEDLTTDALLETGRAAGLDLAGYRLGAELVRDLERAMLPDSGRLADIEQSMIGSPAPWLRAEPDFDPAQADALAAILTLGLRQ